LLQKAPDHFLLVGAFAFYETILLYLAANELEPARYEDSENSPSLNSES
jgi:hypothetical protein